MPGRKSRNRLKENVLLLDMAAEGKCVARIEEKVFFVEGGVPGDVVDILVEKDKKSYAESRVYRMKEPSPDRKEAFCSHFGTCGGCKWQNLEYEKQLEYKAKQVKDAFERIGKTRNGKWFPILPSPRTREYRNKLEFTFSASRWLEFHEIGNNEIESRNALGFHIPGKFDKILEISHCHLQPEPSNEIRNWTRKFAEEQGYNFFNIREQTGQLRNLVIRTTGTGGLMVVLIFAHDAEQIIEPMLSAMKEAFPQITSLQYIINTKRNDAFQDLQAITFSGESFVWEEMEDLRFRVGPTSFYQTNGPQALAMYQLVNRLANAKESDLVYDLYTGTGTIAQFVARKAGKVIGVEYVEAAVADARENARINGLENVRFFSGDMAKVLDSTFFETHGKPDILITDPPRAGMHPAVVNQILESEAKKLIYVSCNPATQARDIAMLLPKYHLLEVHPLDMFPHTHHVENVALLELRK